MMRGIGWTTQSTVSALTFNMRAGSQVSSPRQGLNKLFPIIMASVVRRYMYFCCEVVEQLKFREI